MGFLEDHKTLAIATVAATGGALAFWTISSQRRRLQFQASPTTDFDSFLKMPLDNPASTKKKRKYVATSFEAYLTHTEPSSPSSHLSESVNGADPSPITIAPVPCCPPDAMPVTILYGTEFGFSREIAEKLYQRIENCSNTKNRKKYWPELLNLADFPEGFCLEKCQVVLIACSTQGDGVPPTEAREFCSWLLGPAAPNLSSSKTDTSVSSSLTTTTTPAAAAGAGTATTRVKYSILALGDRSYTHFARCGKTLDARLEELGALRFLPRVDINKEDWVAVDGWIETVVLELDTLNLSSAEKLNWNGVLAFNSSISSTEINDKRYKGNDNGGGVKNTTRWTKSKPYFASVVGVESLCNLSTPLHPVPSSTAEEESTASTNFQSNKTNGSIRNHNDNNKKKNNIKNINEKNTVRVEIDLGNSGIDYLPGDALGVWPTNDPRDVDDLLEAAGITEENILVKVPSWHYQDDEIHTFLGGGDGDGLSSPPNPGLITLREALTRCYDLKNFKPELLQLLDQKVAALKEANVASVTRSFNGGRDSNDQNYLSGRHIADILRDWKPATLTVEELLSVMRQLQPRLYSISSSPLEEPYFASKLSNGVAAGEDNDQRTVQLTVAVLRYESVVGKSRVGVASTYLAERSQWQQQNEHGQPQEQQPPLLLPQQNNHHPHLSNTTKVPVYLYKNPDFRLPSDLKTPIIMVGPGTGVAPFRGFIQHRNLLAKAAAAEKERNGDENASVLGPALLFFGCRRRDEDYLYGSELEKWAQKAGQIQFFTAFSRETEKKIYVQHRLLENGSLVWQLLEAGGVFYVCGDGAHMAGDVETALKSIIEHHQGQGSAAGERYFENLVKSGRYKKDVWVS
ncbi:putative NADPH oxidoreductase A [Nannochloris sp. 'desiccata']|nr:hypothetical protein KSW81_000238 [Chlorella desiccata (nom. nud.)]KAH7620076.1 putative NADPH oxidoreductase A [Chlorella desiccata (nom. nud.)]